MSDQEKPPPSTAGDRTSKKKKDESPGHEDIVKVAQVDTGSSSTVTSSSTSTGPSGDESGSISTSQSAATLPPPQKGAPQQSTGAESTKPTAAASTAESDSDDDDINVEESPGDGRWVKRREEVKQRDVPGIDVAYLAMDTETGNEVVWNEVQFSERKIIRSQEENIKGIFDNLTQLSHSNLVRFYKYWTDLNSKKPRVIFITEYMSSGNMSQFLKRTRQGNKSMSGKAWKKWCTQILSALSYLHSSDPPIVHGNLSCNTIFIQQNGLIKIGCVAPNAIHHHVKTFRENMKNMHYIPPEFEQTTKGTSVTTASDIYSFGVCALEMAVLGFATNGDADQKAPPVVTQELMRKRLDSIDDQLQKNFIESCLQKKPEARPTANDLLFHAVLFEVHSLKLLAAHCIVVGKVYESLPEDSMRIKNDKDRVIAQINHIDGRDSTKFTYDQVPLADLDKFLEDVRNGIYPLTAFAREARQPQTITKCPQGPKKGPTLDRANSPAETPGANGRHGSQPATGGQGVVSVGEEVKETDENGSTETRKVIKIHADMKLNENMPTDAPLTWTLTILLKLEDMMNRQLTAEINEGDSAEIIAKELSHHGFIREDDWKILAQQLDPVVKLKPTGKSGRPTPSTTPTPPMAAAS